MAAIEAATIRASLGTNQLSPLHAGHALSTASGNTLYGFAARPRPDDGGNPEQIMHYAMRDSLNGFVRWADDTTNFGVGVFARSLEITSGINRSFIVPGAYLINTTRASTLEIKTAVMQFGAVTTTMFGDNIHATGFWNSATSAYYQPSGATQPSDHLVLIVGWDDSYPRARFNTQPANDGAWLVKNSWGEGFGIGGYFWLSYEDKYAGVQSWGFAPARPITSDDSTSKTYDINRDHITGSYSGATHGTNVFTAGPSDEKLTQVRVYVNSAPQSGIPIFLTNNYTSNSQVATTINSGTPIATFNASFVGYHTIDIPAASQPTIAANTRFAITVRYAAGSVPITAIRSGGSGRSFIGTNAATQDISASNNATLVKAVTVFASGESPPQIISQPSNLAVESGKNAVFTVSAAGNPVPLYQWQVSTDNGATWTNIAGATTNTLTIANVTISGHNGNRYRVVITNTTGQLNTVTSNPITLTVGEGFGSVPQTGIPNVTGDVAAASVFFILSTSLWACLLIRRRRKNG